MDVPNLADVPAARRARRTGERWVGAGLEAHEPAVPCFFRAMVLPGARGGSQESLLATEAELERAAAAHHEDGDRSLLAARGMDGMFHGFDLGKRDV
jgi:hypothetical protein